MGHRRNSRRVLAWMLISLFVLQCLFVSILDAFRPEIYDPETGVRLKLLQERIREHPDRPVLLVVGSSRIGLGFVPRELPPITTPDGREVIPFNYSHLAAGPRLNLMQVHRALRAGVKPGWVVLEIFPGQLFAEGTQAEHTTAPDLFILAPHADAIKVGLYYVRDRLNPIYKHRRTVLQTVAPTFATRGPESNNILLEPLGDDLAWWRKAPPGEARRAATLEHVKQVYSQRLNTFPIDPKLDGATREFLRLCHDEGIAVVIVLTPEDSLFRSWYGPNGEKKLQEYAASLQRECGVLVIDARAWLPDDQFQDPHHLTPGGASIFTQRLGREVLRPLVTGNLHVTASR